MTGLGFEPALLLVSLLQVRIISLIEKIKLDSNKVVSTYTSC